MVANYLTTEHDRATSIAAVKFARKIAQTNPLQGLIRREIKPERAESDEDLLEFCRNNGATIFHPTGTCQMGPSQQKDAVLDCELRVRGVGGLRVVDCSAMPTLPSGNTNWPAVMMGERAADLILQDLNNRVYTVKSSNSFRRWTLPEAPRGSSSTNFMILGVLNFPKF